VVVAVAAAAVVVVVVSRSNTNFRQLIPQNSCNWPYPVLVKIALKIPESAPKLKDSYICR